MNLTIKELQLYGTEMLKVIAEICERNHIRWFMAYGSVLGAIRHSGPIPWDYDIDIYIPESDLKFFLAVMEKELPDQYYIDYRKGSQPPRAFPRIGLKGYETEILHIDVYRLGGLPENPQELKWFVKFSRLLFIIWKSKTLDIDYYYPDKKRRIGSKFVKAITCLLPLKVVLKLIDRQAGYIPFDTAKIVASPITTMNPKKMLAKKLFDESILVDYENFKVRVPKDYELYLKILFGDWRAFPPKEFRDRELSKRFIVRKLLKGE